MDDERIAGLLSRLDDGPHRPPRVDLARAVRDGRRRRRNRRAVAAGSTALAVVAAVTVVPLLREPTPPDPAPATVTPPTACEVETLPLPPGYVSGGVTGGDPTGRYLVGLLNLPDRKEPHPVLWVDGKVRELPASVRSAPMREITSSGWMIGQDMDAGYVYRFDPTNQPGSPDGDGTDPVRRLPGGPNLHPAGINEAGRIAGNRYSPDDPNWFVPMVWASPTSDPVELPLPGPGWTGRALGIDDDGTIIGTVATDARYPRGYLWRSDGTGEFLPSVPAAGEFRPVSIRNSWVIGHTWREQPGPGREAVRLNLTTGEFVPLPAMFSAVSVNARGWVAGVGDRSAGLFTDAGLLDLGVPRPDPARADLVYVMVSVVSDDGRTIGGRWSPDGKRLPAQPVRWSCR
ncbi:hypothetical protein [Micromonospora echinospora]|uniref:hypothetical protein n=1 Tax=Micromonospora echinospora TaxID=1877 RepID=UPI00366EAB3C